MAEAESTFNYKNFEFLMNKCFEGSWDEFETIIKNVERRLNGQNLVSEQGDAGIQFLNGLTDANALFDLMQHLLDRNPSLSDDLFIDHGSDHLQSGQLCYNDFFTPRTEFAITTIFPVIQGRRHFRCILENNPNEADDINMEIPLYKTLADLPDARVEPKKERFIDRLKEAVNTKLPNSGTCDLNTAVGKFKEYLKKYIDTSTFEVQILLVEELGNCMYWLLDGTVPPPFSSMMAVRRDYYPHRLVRYFLTKSSLHLISQVIQGLEKPLQEEFILSLLQVDRAYLHDSYMTAQGFDVPPEKLGAAYCPFNRSFGEKLNPRTSNYGFNIEIPPEDDVLGEDAKLSDPLQKLIMSDQYFRSLTKRQVEEWYSTEVGKGPPGKWSQAYSVDIDPAHFSNRKGNIIYDYYLPTTVKQLIQKDFNARQPNPN